jgi:hypothetical protein
MLPSVFSVLTTTPGLITGVMYNTSSVTGCFCTKFHLKLNTRGADKSLARPTSLLIVFSVRGTGGSPTGPDPENRMGEQDIGSPGESVSSGSQVPGEPFPSWSS